MNDKLIDPVEIAEDIFWVGHELPDDPFQCHVYLILNGKGSILIDPGSKITFKYALEKIEQIIPFSYIKYFICQHQDPDITASLEIIRDLLIRDDAVIVSHWRAIALLKHYNLNIPMICVEKENWKLNAGGRELEFIFTPYCHFPGAFCTYDKKSKVLFSSDLFGGFTDRFKLFAEDINYFDSIAAFHEPYMPSKEILVHSLKKIEQYDIDLIAPQHGSIIRRDLIKPIINKMKNLDCGLFLLTQSSTELEKLRKLNKFLNAFLETMATYKDFTELIREFVIELRSAFDFDSIEFYTDYKGTLLYFLAETPSIWEKIKQQEYVKDILQIKMSEYYEKYPNYLYVRNVLYIPIPEIESDKIIAVMKLYLKESIVIDNDILEILKEVINFLSIAFEREFIRRKLIEEREKFYEISIHDTLTGCYSRYYLKETIKRVLAIHDRGEIRNVGIVMLDIDDFKNINDTYGHDVGDEVLKVIADIIKNEVRVGDIPVRYGGEEFMIVAVVNDIKSVYMVAERIRTKLEEYKWDAPLDKERITASFGVVLRKKGESFEDVIKRVDINLYKAKSAGKNTVICEE
ncbi:conserved hypothetical protein [Deferribacter desulfuricans SSM1]|uniref:diguanylate cyclase n=1 Tax=Deferribacter desulfuricans (strain DSM 14783 / JCM 11476 / NBRC 101012 / SSM1) TaxID=639282 RepID=D3PAW3_DEFDS|nr:diguanylate cyclase [Deferribacter desulfuricans]BAI79736.1 conserved hypothetical protein [Deferribacter desulfuricans SSM1]